MWARIFNPVGPGQDERHLCGAGPAGGGDRGRARVPEITVGPLHTTRDYLDVRDTASALRVLATAGEPGGTYNVASGVETPGSHVLARLEALAGVTLELRTRALPPRRFDMDRHVADVSRLEALGWVPGQDLDASLGAVLDYYAEEVATRSVPAGRTVPQPRSTTFEPITLRPDRTERCTVEVDTGLLLGAGPAPGPFRRLPPWPSSPTNGCSASTATGWWRRWPRRASRPRPWSCRRASGRSPGPVRR